MLRDQLKIIKQELD